MTKNQIIEALYKRPFIDDLIWTITGGSELRGDLKQELFIILLQMDDARIIGAFTNKFLDYLCVNILKKQFHSKTSPFYNKFRKSEVEFRSGADLPQIPEMIEADNDEVIRTILEFVDTKLPLVDRELFKIYWKFGKYDRLTGELRDMTCDKAKSSLRKVSKKLQIKGEGITISIGHDSVRKSLNRTLLRIKTHLLKYDDL